MVLFRDVCGGRESGSAGVQTQKGCGVSGGGSESVGVHPAHSYALEYSPR